MILTERDITLLEKLSDYGLLSSRQIEKLVFPGTARTTVLRRLRMLLQHKLISRSVGVEGGPLLWVLEEKGAKKIGLGFPYGPINRNLIEHNSILSQIRLSLEGVGLIQDWKGEHILKREISQKKSRYRDDPEVIPDGLISVSSPKGIHVLALELELTAKNKTRYEEVFDSYTRKRQIGALWYIVPHQKFGEWLSAEWANPKRDRKKGFFFWSHLKEILHDPWNAKFYAKEKAHLLREVFQMQESKSFPSASSTQK